MHARVKRVPLSRRKKRVIKKVIEKCTYKHTRSSLDVNEKSEEKEKKKRKKLHFRFKKKMCENPQTTDKDALKKNRTRRERTDWTDRRQKKERKKKKGSYSRE
jgi:hypothetical protein